MSDCYKDVELWYIYDYESGLQPALDGDLILSITIHFYLSMYQVQYLQSPFSTNLY